MIVQNQLSKTQIPSIETIDARELLSLDLEALAKAYRSAQPYPHIVLDGIFPESLLRSVAAEIHTSDETIEKSFYGSFQKHRISNISALGPTSRRFIDELNAAPFLRFLEAVTGIDSLIPDPHLEGGGIHQIGPGGFLKVHTDFNWHRSLKLHRRINILVYLNENWQDDWNGHLELWDEKVSSCGARIAPVFNRMVIFSTTDESYHGHPDPLTCPAEVRRNSVALYYYSAERPASETRFGTSTMTNYRERPEEEFGKGKLKHFLHQLLIRTPLIRKAVGREK